MEKKKSIPAFLRNTYAMLERQQLCGIVAWGQGGQGFVIKDLARFSAQILPQYFKHQKYTSFVRQLNMYGFHKQRAHDYPIHHNHQYFAHQHFRRGDAQSREQGARMLLAAIRRKPEKKKKNSSAPSQPEQPLPPTENQQLPELQSCSSARSVSLQVEEEVKGNASGEQCPQEEWQSQAQGSWEGVDAVTESVMAQNQLLRDLHPLIRQEVLAAKKRTIARFGLLNPYFHTGIDQQEQASITRLTELLLQATQRIKQREALAE